MSTISVSVHQRSSSFSIFIYATTANGVVFLPITLQQFKSLTRDVPSNTIVGGIPAKVLKSL